MKKLVLIAAFLYLGIPLSYSQQSPETFLGYEMGTNFTRHHQIVDYFKHIAEVSSQVRYQEYGKTYEGRPLTYAIVSSEENLEQLETIRQNHLQNAGLASGSSPNAEPKAIVWLSYNVHGNEASSSEAAMTTLYELITNRRDWLENTVIIIDPVVNPDGRDRYVNWYKQVKATPYDTQPIAAEHREPWPGGRPNHYLFDLNRDWAWATQTETRQRLEVYNKWLPHIHVDFHEQGINDPYYFAPAATPFHQIITPFQSEFQTEIGKQHARYFDEEGWLYFTKERFDLLYPSYGDTYPTFMGAIGMTYEQAGHGRAGLGIKTSEGYILSLKDRIAHHHMAGLSTVEIAAQNAGRLHQEFHQFFQNHKSRSTTYVLQGDSDKIESLKELLDRHQIEYRMAARGKTKGKGFGQKGISEFRVDDRSLIVPVDQPKGKMVNVLFEPSTKLEDSLTYDITAWSLPYAYGLDAFVTQRKPPQAPQSGTERVQNTAEIRGAGYISAWKSMQDARFLAALLTRGIKVRFTETPIKTEGKNFNAGSLVITRSDNRNRTDFDQTLVRIADSLSRKLTPVRSGFAEEGPDFGSPQVRIINAPRIAVLRGSSVSSLNYGEVWHFFEQELNYPLTSINTLDFKQVDLTEWDILILPGGRYRDILEENELERLKAWIQRGGKIIALGSALDAFEGAEGFGLKKNPQTEKDSLSKENLVPYAEREREYIKNMITGSIVETKVDSTHPLAFGYGEKYRSLKLDNSSYSYLDEGYNVAYLPEDPKIISGFAGSRAQKAIASSLVFGEKPVGNGTAIYMVDNPLFRGFWENGKLFFVNALFLVNNDRYRLEGQPVAEKK